MRKEVRGGGAGPFVSLMLRAWFIRSETSSRFIQKRSTTFTCVRSLRHVHSSFFKFVCMLIDSNKIPKILKNRVQTSNVYRNVKILKDCMIYPYVHSCSYGSEDSHKQNRLACFRNQPFHVILEFLSSNQKKFHLPKKLSFQSILKVYCIFFFLQIDIQYYMYWRNDCKEILPL